MSAVEPEAPLAGETPVPEPTPTPVVPDWSTLRASLPVELRDSPVLAPYGAGDAPTGLAGLVKDHLEVQKLVGGDKVTKPGEKATVQDYARFYSELGRPDSADQYDLGDFAPPAGMPWDPDLQKGLMQDLFDAGCSNVQANRILRAYTDRTEAGFKGVVELLSSNLEANTSELKTDWGVAYDANHEQAKRVFAVAFGDDLEAVGAMELTDGSMVGDNPIFVRGMYEIGRRMAEGTLVEGIAPRGPAITPEAALVEIAAVLADPDKAAIITDRSHLEHDIMKKKMHALYAAAYPEE